MFASTTQALFRLSVLNFNRNWFFRSYYFFSYFPHVWCILIQAQSIRVHVHIELFILETENNDELSMHSYICVCLCLPVNYVSWPSSILIETNERASSKRKDERKTTTTIEWMFNSNEKDRKNNNNNCEHTDAPRTVSSIKAKQSVSDNVIFSSILQLEFRLVLNSKRAGKWNVKYVLVIVVLSHRHHCEWHHTYCLSIRRHKLNRKRKPLHWLI